APTRCSAGSRSAPTSPRNPLKSGAFTFSVRNRARPPLHRDMHAGADREWIEASRRGDRAAFARLIERHQRAVYAVAFSATRDRALADDVTQDAFVTGWRR